VWLALSVTRDAHWTALARCIGRSAWSEDPRLAHLEGRRAAHDEIDSAITAWSAQRPVAEAVETLLRVGVPAAEAIGPRRAQELEPIAHGDFVENVEHAVVGRLPVAAIPIRLERRSSRWFDRPAPTLGEHNREVLCGLAGVDEARFATLADDGIIGSRPKGI
jgi:crotonobetainyl-CoA:carnitine CoA-transferase CaiB-like acyl-CoA transferase